MISNTNPNIWCRYVLNNTRINTGPHLLYGVCPLTYPSRILCMISRVCVHVVLSVSPSRIVLQIHSSCHRQSPCSSSSFSFFFSLSPHTHSPNRSVAKPQASSEAMAERRTANSQLGLCQRIQIDSIRKEFAMLFLLHSTAVALLFSSSSQDLHGFACRRCWILSVCFSLGIIWPIRYKTNTEGLLEKLLEKERR